MRSETRRSSTVVSFNPPLRALVSGVRARYVITCQLINYCHEGIIVIKSATYHIIWVLGENLLAGRARSCQLVGDGA